MLLTISTTHSPATDLGYLLHKHPDRVQHFRQSFGTAIVCYPEATDERCTAALILDIDGIELARHRTAGNSPDFSLAQYVNDRPYAASSLLGVAVADIFSTARAGRCNARPELADRPIPLELGIPVLPCNGGAELARRIFEPLGWTVSAEPIGLDETFPDWGDSRYLRLRLTGTIRLADALKHLHVLLPVFDEAKHYWQGPDEVDKLLRSGGAWLAAHPDRELITRRYLRRRGLVDEALARLAELDGDTESALTTADGTAADTDDIDMPAADRIPLNAQRHEEILRTLVGLDAKSVIDLGCGSGAFLEQLVATSRFTRIVGTDVSLRALRQATRRLWLDRPDRSEREIERVQVFQSALTYADPRLAGFDAAVLMEVIEHVDESRLGALERVVFAEARPGAVLVSTPNREHNTVFDTGRGTAAPTGLLRHPDHRFEWDRAEFAAWCDRVAGAHGYLVEIRSIGRADPTHGAPTQLGVFTRD
ncbi:3' terminal RNA ribose 2'-O-methyltransferase Hen1 [Granulicoccus sp. GXG6511]|uniref:3' terminal RNA ribose 2'-O-methyltransferase Hen1 n=1 Tax=Granulicoccus sp. GXG6511 TaxID=3381351 RepID=UPI003D7E007C